MDTSAVRWSVDDPASPEAAAVDDGLSRYNEQAADLGAVRPFVTLARDRSGSIIGGALARRWGACCEIQQIWVDEDHRSHGIGRELMRLVEDHARANGCSLVYLDTFSFQAPGFYIGLGYDVACEFKGFPDGASKFIMSKMLA